MVKMTVGVRRRTHEKVQYDLPQESTGDVYLMVGLGASDFGADVGEHRRAGEEVVGEGE